MNDSTGKASLNLKVAVYFRSLSPDLLPVTNVRKRGSYRGGLSHGSRTEKTANPGSRLSKFQFPESRK